jgi:hypothetical protein
MFTMQSATFIPRLPAARRLLVAGLALAAAAAQAAGGYSVAPAQEKLVTAGMSQGEVKQALGRPAQTMRYVNEAGPTWTWDVNTVGIGGADQTVFDVDFGADGRVASAQERVIQRD